MTQGHLNGRLNLRVSLNIDTRLEQINEQFASQPETMECSVGAQVKSKASRCNACLANPLIERAGE